MPSQHNRQQRYIVVEGIGRSFGIVLDQRKRARELAQGEKWDNSNFRWKNSKIMIKIIKIKHCKAQL